MNMNTYGKESMTPRCRRSTLVQLYLTYFYIDGTGVLVLCFGYQLVVAELIIYALVAIIGSDNACRRDGAKPLSEPMLEYC